MAVNIFERASRLKMRFQFNGLISAEDLWDLSDKDLDTIYKDLTKKAKAIEGETLMKRNVENEKLTLATEIVEHVFRTKQAEREAKEQSAENAAKRTRMLEILAKKQEASLLEMSEEELLAKINEL